MIRKTVLLVLGVLVLVGLGGMTACGMLSPETSLVAQHQVLEAGRPTCSDCHENETMKGSSKTFASFNHTPEFVKNHRFQANRDSGTCASCHKPSFCADCHGGKTPMRPSVKLSDRPDRDMPHRGNYLTLHRMEGKIDPTGCYKCHGRANNDKCTTCHR